MSITYTLEISHMAPQQLAHLFTEMDDHQQAEFFAEIWRIAKAWPGAGWCQQSSAIVQSLDKDGFDAVATLAGHLEPDLADLLSRVLTGCRNAIPEPLAAECDAALAKVRGL